MTAIGRRSYRVGPAEKNRSFAPGLALATSVVVVAGLLAGCGGGRPRHSAGTFSPSGVADPSKSSSATPDYYEACAPTGIDNTKWCLQVTLKAIDNARIREGLGPLLLPADFPSLAFPEQLLIVVDRERVDRRLPPFASVTDALNAVAARGARVDDLPPGPGKDYSGVRSDFDDGFLNVLDLDYMWMYDDGPGSPTSGCAVASDPGCWADRHIVLGRYRARGRSVLVMGAAVDPTADTHSYDRGGPAMAALFAVSTASPGPIAASWSTASRSRAGVLVPLKALPPGYSLSGIADPPHTEPPFPDYTAQCAERGLDSSVRCSGAVLAAIDAARTAEGVKPMVLPAGFDSMPVPDQLFVVVNLERVDRGLPPFTGTNAEMDANAQAGADSASDPPNPRSALFDDELWAGGSVDALDADYGWMYDDGRGSSNLDCPRSGGPGCWDHRNAILDAFGPVGHLVMGTAVDPAGDTAVNGDKGGPSMAVTLAVTTEVPDYLLLWASIASSLPSSP